MLYLFFVFRAVIGDGENIICQRPVIEPVNLSLGLRRNLAAAWTHVIPDLDMTGSIKAVKVGINN